MFKISMRFTPLLMVLAGLLIAAAGDPARAQPTVGLDKRLCVGIPTTATIAACVAASTPVTTVSPYAAIFYVIDVSNAPTGAAGPVNVTDTFQPGFNFITATCSATGSSNPCIPFIAGAIGAITAAAPFNVPVNLGQLLLATNQTAQVVITGFFSVPNGGSANNSVTVTGGTASPITKGVNAQLASDLQQTNDLSIVKSVTPSSIDVSNGPVTVHYQVIVKNTGPALYLGQIFTLVDELRIPTTSAPFQATFLSATCSAPGSDCLAAPVPVTSPLIVGTSTWAPFLKWRYPTSGPGSSGLLVSGGTITLGWDVRVERLLDCVKQQSGGDFLDNHAFFNLTTTNGITIAEQNPGNDFSDNPPNSVNEVAVTTGAYIVDPFCGVTIPNAPPPLLALTKKQLPPLTPVSWPGSASYAIQLKNNGPTPIFNINLLDFMREDPGTPPHSVQLTAWNCVPAAACAGVNPVVPPGPVQSQQFYFSAKQMWRGTIPVLAPAQTVTLNITVQFTDPTCDSLDITSNTNTNLARASYQANVVIASVPTLVTYHLGAAVTTPMAAVAKCKFNVVKKILGPTLTGFPQTVNYNVQFLSQEIVPRKVVVYDALRVMPANYTAGMPFTATYSCTPSPAGSVIGPIPGSFPVVGVTNGTVVNTTLPSQGVRVFQSTGFLTFAPGAALSCNVSVTVNRPPPSDPYCLGTAPGGQLENLGYMTVSLIPNNNAFPPSGTYNGVWPLPPTQPPNTPTLSNWRSVTDLLPRCFNLVVNKTAVPPTTWTPGGPPITYTLTVTNLGSPIGPADNLTVADTLTPNHLASAFTASCTNPTLPCGSNWSPTPTTTNPSTLKIPTLGTNQTSTATLTLVPPFTVPFQKNGATATIGGPNGTQLWYPKNPGTLAASATVSVLGTNSLTVKKVIKAPPGDSLPNFSGVVFPVNVICTPFGPSVGVNLTAAAPSQVIPNIPITSTCNVTEPPVVQTGTCGRPLVGVAFPPTYLPGQTITITAPPAALSVEVDNVIGCVPVGSWTIFKTVVNLTHVPLPNVQFPVTITCNPFGSVIHLNLPATNSSQTVSIPDGSNCTIVEGPLPPPALIPGACPGTNALAGWTAPAYLPGQTTTIQPQPAGSNPQNVRINNEFVCNP